VEENLHPGFVSKAKATGAVGGKDAAERLAYLERRLHLTQIVQPNQDRVRFLLDPLAEYLAGLHLVEQYADREDAWRHLFERAEAATREQPVATRGFLLALRECCLARGEGGMVPAWVETELARLAGLSPEALRRARLEQR